MKNNDHYIEWIIDPNKKNKVFAWDQVYTYPTFFVRSRSIKKIFGCYFQWLPSPLVIPRMDKIFKAYLVIQDLHSKEQAHIPVVYPSISCLDNYTICSGVYMVLCDMYAGKGKSYISVPTHVGLERALSSLK